jgi:hypothetical protein
VAVVAGLALAAGGVAIAAGDPSPTPSPTLKLEPAPNGPGEVFSFAGPLGPGLPFLDGAGIGLAGPPVHGEFTVPKEGGGYETVHMQRGTVTTVDASSITVKSEDGFVDTYAVDDKTLVDGGRTGIGSVKSGHRVVVSGVDVGGALTARHIIDATLVEKYFKEFGPPKRPPLLRDLRHLKMRLRSHIRGWLDGSAGTNSATSTYAG